MLILCRESDYSNISAKLERQISELETSGLDILPADRRWRSREPSLIEKEDSERSTSFGSGSSSLGVKLTPTSSLDTGGSSDCLEDYFELNLSQELGPAQYLGRLFQNYSPQYYDLETAQSISGIGARSTSRETFQKLQSPVL